MIKSNQVFWGGGMEERDILVPGLTLFPLLLGEKYISLSRYLIYFYSNEFYCEAFWQGQAGE